MKKQNHSSGVKKEKQVNLYHVIFTVNGKEYEAVARDFKFRKKKFLIQVKKQTGSDAIIKRVVDFGTDKKAFHDATCPNCRRKSLTKTEVFSNN